ncbi:predicted protein [Nematostella vectensis]|uniref:Protein fem-1 homolog B n=1 Tax=Nematostella vectensis TaxID=45351 RepID=A7T1E6_NEMVE|nr:predicted protein [Nematostella vectensis]|eukprot:XP_001622320.1 hypothetical protein NEMVEDRAFT_v1g195416 [Nematostella vectensis]
MDIVSFLVDNGAQVNVCNNFENTPLMVACYNGHRDVVMYLVKKGASMDMQDKQGNSVLHYGVERGHLEIVKELVRQGAKHLPNKLGLTPLLLASNDCKTEMVEYFISEEDCPQIDRIDALELLGATIANEPDVYDTNLAFEFITRGMTERFQGDKCIYKKKLLPPIEAYQNRVECQTINELQEIKHNPHAIHMEGLLIRERILGSHNTELRFPIRYRGAVFADSANFELCISLWKHAMDIGQKNDQVIIDDLKIFGDFFCHMIQRSTEPTFRNVLDVFDHAVTEFEKLTNKAKLACEKSLNGIQDDIDSVVHRTLYFLTIFTKLRLSEIEEGSLQTSLFKYLCLNPRTAEGLSLLHLAVSNRTPTDEHYTKDICRYPCLLTTNLLLKNRVHVNTIDKLGNTPLHVAVATKPKLGFLTTTKNVIKALLAAGSHEDLSNKDGKTAMDIAASEELKKVLLSGQKISLKCISARAVARYKLNYVGLVPKTIEAFIKTH